MRKKILCILLAFVVILTLSACIKKTASDPTPAPTASAAPGQVADAIPNAVLNATSTPAPIPDLTPRPTRSPAPETPMPLSSAAPKPSASSEPAPSATPAAVAAAQNEGRDHVFEFLITLRILLQLLGKYIELIRTPEQPLVQKIKQRPQIRQIIFNRIRCL